MAVVDVDHREPARQLVDADGEKGLEAILPPASARKLLSCDDPSEVVVSSTKSAWPIVSSVAFTSTCSMALSAG